MKIIYLITAHKNPAQIARLVNRLNDDEVSFLIHIDKKTDTSLYKQTIDLCSSDNVQFIEPRVSCNYMCFGILSATIKGLQQSLKSEFDFLINLSGQDYPIKSNERIKAFLSANRGRSFMSYHTLPFEGWLPNGGLNRYESWNIEIGNRQLFIPLEPIQFQTLHKMKLEFVIKAANLLLPKRRSFLEGFQPYGGWAFWCLARKHVEYADEFIEKNRSFVNYFKHVSVPDEMFFQTLFMNSQYKGDFVSDDLRFIEWVEGDSHPKIFTEKDFDKIANSEKLFARKFDMSIDKKILERIDKELLM